MFDILRLWILHLKVSAEVQHKACDRCCCWSDVNTSCLQPAEFFSSWLLTGLSSELLKMKWRRRPRWESTSTQLPDTESKQIFEIQTSRVVQRCRLYSTFSLTGGAWHSASSNASTTRPERRFSFFSRGFCSEKMRLLCNSVMGVSLSSSHTQKHTLVPGAQLSSALSPLYVSHFWCCKYEPIRESLTPGTHTDRQVVCGLDSFGSCHPASSGPANQTVLTHRCVEYLWNWICHVASAMWLQDKLSPQSLSLFSSARRCSLLVTVWHTVHSSAPPLQQSSVFGWTADSGGPRSNEAALSHAPGFLQRGFFLSSSVRPPHTAN